MGDYATFPTVTTGFAQLEPKLSGIMEQAEEILEKVEKLEIERAMNAIAEAANEGKDMAATARKFLEDEKLKGIPANISETLEELKTAIATLGPEGEINRDVEKTLKELRAAIASIKAVADILEEKPNALIFGKGREKKNDEDNRRKTGPRSRQIPPFHPR